MSVIKSRRDNVEGPQRLSDSISQLFSEREKGSEIKIKELSDEFAEVNPYLPVKEVEENLKKTEKGKSLTHNDIIDILEIYNEGEMSMLIKLKPILESNINLRGKIFGINWIEELYHGDNLLPEDLRLSKPEPDDIKSSIREEIRAIILDEYVRLHKLASSEFLKGKTTYKEYMEWTGRYFKDASNLWI